jgi:hydroxyatrazine ethylaminohydrolase
MINGRIVWHKGEFPGIDEGALFAAAEETLHTILPNTTNGDNHV